ncbi:MAG: superoxide dismutase, Ni [Patescibacteria group bacterium]|nr:superoxide dismutase, Ni [Patescibacteria group bacterium]
MYRFISFIHKLIPFNTVYAHCDIPCGIYTSEPAHTAARTVVRMVELIEELEIPDWKDKKVVMEYENSMSRYVATKEEHAQICKEQLLILWTDFFNKEHLEIFPDLHDTFWSATKLCSKIKQEVSMDTAKGLLSAVENIAEMFEKASSK